MTAMRAFHAEGPAPAPRGLFAASSILVGMLLLTSMPVSAHAALSDSDSDSNASPLDQNAAYLSCVATPNSCTSLDLSDLDLTGTIPSAMGSLTKLTKLLLSGNDLSGTLPIELQDLTKLQEWSTSCNANLCGCVPAGMATYQTSDVLDGTHLGTLCLPGRRAKSPRCAGGSDSDADTDSDSDNVDWSLIRTYHGQVVPPAAWPWVCGQQFVGSADGVVGAVNRSINKLISDETRRTSHTTHGRSGALFSTGSHSNRPDGADIGLPTGAVTWLPDGRDGATVHPGVYPMESNLAGVATQSADSCMQSEPGVFSIQAVGKSKEDAAQSCADVHGEGWGLAKFTAQEFSCQQSAVAEAVTASVGPDQPVMTGVQSANDQCMTATATTTNEVMWTETACAQSADLPTMCRQANPEETASTILPGAYRAEAGVAEGALSMPVIFLFGCVAGAAVVVVGTYRKQLSMMGGSRRAAVEPGTEKAPLVAVASKVATAKTESHGYTQV